MKTQSPMSAMRAMTTRMKAARMLVTKTRRKRRKMKMRVEMKVRILTTIFLLILFHSLTFPLPSFCLSVPLPNNCTTGPPAAKKQKTAPASKDKEGAEKENGTNGTAKTSAPAEEAVKTKGGDVPKESALPEVEDAEEAEE